MNTRHLLTNALAATAGMILVAFPPPMLSQLPSVAEYASGMERLEGFIPMTWDAKTGRLLFEIERLEEDFVYLQSLATGIGSSPLLLDRRTIGPTHIGRFQRVRPDGFEVAG